MALLAHAMVSLETLKDYLGLSGSGANKALERAINGGTEWLEGEADRHFVSRGALTEYHSPEDSKLQTLQLRQWPIVSVTSVHESTDAPRVYDATTLLSAGTDFQSVDSPGQLRRLSSSELSNWARGYRTVKVVYEAGYQDQDGSPAGGSVLPADLEILCLFVAAAIFKEAERGRWGVSSVTDSLGTQTRFLGYLPPDMKSRLDAYRRREFSRTWEAA